MTRLTMLFAFCAMVLLVSCKDKKAQKDEEEQDSEAATLSAESNVQMPIFLYYYDRDRMQMIYWCSPNEEVRNEQQDSYTKNAAAYTHFFVDGEEAGTMEYMEEQVLTPDGDPMDCGQLHWRGMPSAGLVFQPLSGVQKLAPSDYGYFAIGATDDFLATHKPMNVKHNEWYSEGGDKPLPVDVVKKLESQYDMKAARSHIACTMEDGYSYGILQFEVKNQKVVALEVLMHGDDIYSVPVEGFYDETYGAGWNVDDDGIYFPSSIYAAFLGPEGPVICFVRRAPESCATGFILVRDGKLVRDELAIYYVNIDEGYSKPLWKKDLAKLEELYHAAEPSASDVKFKQWAYIDVDGDGFDEIWLRDADDDNSAFFTLKEGPKLLCMGNNKMKLSVYQNCIVSEGPCGGPCYAFEVITMKNSQIEHQLNYMTVEGRAEGCELDGKEISQEEAEKFKSKATLNVHDTWPTWQWVSE